MSFAVTTEGVAAQIPTKPVIEKWVAALESGEYTQTEGTLQRINRKYHDDPEVGFCCLGVLCDLAVKEGVIEPPTPNVSGIKNTFDGNNSDLPESVRVWAGLPEANPTVDITSLGLVVERYIAEEDRYVEEVDKEESLAELNDEHGLGFHTIAQILRENYLEK